MRRYTDVRQSVRSIGGFTTEDAAWQMILDLVIQKGCEVSPDTVFYQDGHFVLETEDGGSGGSKSSIDSSNLDVWSLGATVFYMLLGVEPFDGKGRQSQTAQTPLPMIGLQYASDALSRLVARCMSYDLKDRPTLDEIRSIAEKNMEGEVAAKRHEPRKLSHTATGRGYLRSLVDFWPEEMVSGTQKQRNSGAQKSRTLGILILAIGLWLMACGNVQAQVTPTTDMKDFVGMMVSMRTAPNTSALELRLQRNSKWTVMDELAIDRKGECTVKDKVSSFGFNKAAYRVEARRSGVTATNSRLRDGRNKKYNYSIIEITVKKGLSVSYDIPERSGVQTIAVIPHDRSLAQGVFPVKLTRNGKPEPCSTEYTADGVLYLQTKTPLTDKDNLRITIGNRSTANQSFVLINHNPRK